MQCLYSNMTQNVEMDNKISRAIFLKRLIRIMMASLLAFIAISLGKRISVANDCSNCPGEGICKGESDCSKFLQDAK